MPTIPPPTEACTVLVTIDAPPEIVAEMEGHARTGLQKFPEHRGFIGGALHRSVDGGRLVQYLQWSSESDYQACMNDPRWEDLPSTSKFLALASSPHVKLDARIYTILAASDRLSLE